MNTKRPGPVLQMQDVLLACGELNERERVAVQWVLDRANEEIGKRGELIQRLVDALWTVHTGHTDYLDVQDAIDAAKAAGLKPSNE